MTSVQIHELRTRLNLSQTEFANLFGLHSMTISKWERGLYSPNAYQQALLKEFDIAAREKEVRDTLGAVLIGAGIAAALYLLLSNSRS